MTIFGMLYKLLIGPLELLFEVIFVLANRKVSNPAYAIIALSLAMNFLVLPLYRRADAMQAEERDREEKMRPWIDHIKKTFKGDERFMMLQTYYRENGYSPVQALNGSLSLLLEIPFFIAAYHFLSNLEALNGASFGPISDLGKPDRLFTIGAFGINILPIAMTIINCISSAVYLKGFPLKDKIQTYGMALIFLVLLYNSPSGLVVYWTCNNIFGLVKNIFYKLKHPRKVFDILAAGGGTLFTIAVIISGILNSKKKLIAVVLFMLLCWLPFVLSLIAKKKECKVQTEKEDSGFSKNFIYYTGIFITVLLGILIPSSVIASSPAEFVDIQNYQNPLRYVVYTLSYSAGFFILWTAIIYHILQPKARKVFSVILYAASIVFIINFLFFGKGFGILSPFLVYDKGMVFSKKEALINLAVFAATVTACIFTFRFSKHLRYVYIVLIISLAGVSVRNISHAQKLLSDMSYIKNNDASHHTTSKLFSLSTKGKNVIVFMLDKAINAYFPYFLEEKPELKEQFSGFVYYPNTLSFGYCTNFGTPALFGGYEYTVPEMNKRSDEFLKDKHNEALKVLPWIFDDAGYQVTVCDPPYAGYKWIPDLSVFDDNPNIKTCITMGNVKNEALIDTNFITKKLKSNTRNFFFYSLIKTMPLPVSKVIYDKGHYFDSEYFEYNNIFYEKFSVLTLLPEITDIEESTKNTFLSIDNETTHNPTLLQLPDYTISLTTIDNSAYKTAADGKIPMDNDEQINTYHANVASIIQLGKWLEWMKENGVYDNTRIILVSDHGGGLKQFDYMQMTSPEINVEFCNPLFLVKDFNARGEIITDNTFMTNADTPTLAVQGIIDNPVNPFTGKKISSDEKNKHPQIVNSSLNYDIDINNGKVFDSSDGHFYSVHDNIFDEKNWELIK